MPLQTADCSRSEAKVKLNIGDHVRFSYTIRRRIAGESRRVELTGFIHETTTDSLTIANYNPYREIPPFRDRIKRRYDRNEIAILEKV